MTIRSLIIVVFFTGALFQACIALAAEQPVITSRTIEEKGRYHTITVRCPSVASKEKGDAAKKLNGLIEAYSQSLIKDFKRDLSQEKWPSDRVEVPWSLDAAFDTKYGDHRCVSFVFSGSAFTGGAHPSPFYHTLTYDFQSTREVALGDLFTPGTPYLEEISQYCTRELKNRKLSDVATLEAGAAPKADNYTCFYVSRSGLGIIFPPYQVACYAEGPQEIVIPFSHLSKNVRTGGILDWVRKR